MQATPQSAVQMVRDQQLAWAVFNDKVTLQEVRAMLREGASANARFTNEEDFGDRTDCSLLHLAARNGRADVLELLLSYGAIPDVPDEDGYTPLHTAAWRGTPATMQALAEAGASVEYKTRYGNSIAHSAMQANGLRTLGYTLQLGLDVHARNSQTKTPMNYARARGVFKQAEQLVAATKAWPKARITKQPDGTVNPVAKESLFTADKNGHAPLEHPMTWHTALPLLDAPLSRDDLLNRKDSQGRPWLVRAIECRQLDAVDAMLKSRGECLKISDWVDARGQATEALQALTRKESLNRLFRGAAGEGLHTQELRRIHQALPEVARAQITGYQQLIVSRDQQNYGQGGGRGR